MRYLFLALLTTCNTYTGIIIHKGQNRPLEVKITDFHYVLPLMTIDDTLLIDKTTLRVIR
jgi:hypothetical protein